MTANHDDSFLALNSDVHQTRVRVTDYLLNHQIQAAAASSAGSGQSAASFAYDARGNLTGDGIRTFTYDIENRLVGTSSGLTLTYDPLGRLFQTAGGPSGTTRFLYDGDSLVAEYNSAGTLLRRYVHGSGVDQPLLWYEGSGVSWQNRRQLFADPQGSIVGVTDYVGNPIATNRYDEYGIPASTNSGRFGYTGQMWLPELGMYYYRARIYSPTFGRFLQTDPIGYGGGMNLYAYVGKNPVDFTDPSGLTWRTWCVEEVGKAGQFCRTTWIEDNLDLLPGPFSTTQVVGLIHDLGNALDGVAETTLRPPEPRRQNETEEQCRSRVAGGPDRAVAGATSVGAGARLVPYPRATPGGGGTSVISTLSRALFGPNLRMGSTRIFGTNSVDGAIGRGLSQVSVFGGAALFGYAVGEQVGAMQICQSR